VDTKPPCGISVVSVVTLLVFYCSSLYPNYVNQCSKSLNVQNEYNKSYVTIILSSVVMKIFRGCWSVTETLKLLVRSFLSCSTTGSVKPYKMFIWSLRHDLFSFCYLWNFRMKLIAKMKHSHNFIPHRWKQSVIPLLKII